MTPVAVTIRATQASDVRGIMLLLRDVAAENRWIRTEVNFDIDERARLMTASLDSGRLIGFVAEAADTIVGEISARVVADRATIGMAVAVGYRGRGIGRSLMDAVIVSLRERAVRFVDLHVYDHNVPAIGLYRSLGFIETGPPSVEVRLNGEPWPVIPMTLDL
jgi:ribosomal protein S18 acetylase RimI-like enzyme